MAKRRILFCGEASYLSTGFSVYSHEVIKRLHDTGKFLIAELGSYGKDGDQRAVDVPWKFYTVEPSPDNKEGMAAFHGKNTNQFGEWRFTDVLLDFRPDIVWDHRDWWMSEFQGRHSLRANYHWCIMPTVDGEPQRERWIDTYKQADSVFCYSQYGYDVLARQSKGKINLCEIASPCADVNVFKPVENKKEHKNKMGFDPDSFIIGMVARNQKRKLYGDLIEMYASLLSKLKRSGKRDLAAKTYLYLHTTYPDSGFDIGRFVRENKVGTRVLMTYFCNKCNTTFPTTFKGEVTFCPKCNQYGAFAPHANAHCSREQLAAIYNLFDIYIQYTICEGYGMPALEAKACGVPVMAVDYSAMEDHANSPGGMPIRVERYFHECMIETEQKRALPDNDDCANQLMTLIKKGKNHLQAIGQKGRDYVMEVVADDYNLPRFSWDRTAAIWEKHFETCPVPDREKTWDFPEAKLIHSNGNIPDGLDNTEFVKWCCINIYRRPDLVNTCEIHDLVKNLNCGFRQEGNGCPHCHRESRIRIGRQEIINYFTNFVGQYNQAETRRVQIVKPLETNCEVL